MPSATFFNLPEQKRQTLLHAARAEFARVPFDQASINRIIRQAGIPRGSFYMYFRDKEDLFRYLLEHHLEQLLSCLSQFLALRGGDPFSAFLDLFDAACRTRQSPATSEWMACLRHNSGIQQGALLRVAGVGRLVERIAPLVDPSCLSLRRESDLTDILCILASVTAPMLIDAVLSEDPAPVRDRFCAQLDLLRRGMAAAGAPMT